MIGSMDPVCSIDLAKHLWNVPQAWEYPLAMSDAREQTGFLLPESFRTGHFCPTAMKGKFFTMKRKLTAKEYTYVASMLFGLFFGAGNLIFPVHLGQMAGSNVWLAILGLLITGVGLPLLGVAALGISRSNGLFDLSSKVNRPYAMFFTCALYLTIGPFFAIPRCARRHSPWDLSRCFRKMAVTHCTLLLFSVAFFSLRRSFFRTAPGQDPDLGRQNSEPLLSRLPRHSGRRRAPLSECGHHGCRAARRLRVPAVFSLASSKGTTPWTRWRVLPSASSSCRSSVTSAWTIPPLWRGAPSRGHFQQPSDGVHLHRRHDRRHAEPRRA